MSEKEIIFKNVSLNFGEKQVLKDLNLTIKPGEVIGIMGASGIGKTTFVKVLLGLLKPSAGNVTGLENIKFSAVFQEDRLCEGSDAITNVKMVLPSDIGTEQVEKEFSKVFLSDYKGKPISKLSGGMKRRVAIVRAVMAQSDVIILDEPLKGLDESLKEQVLSYLKDSLSERTVILVTHDKAEVEALHAKLLYFS
ncbi:ATP-binding cassette domain-containing protein [Lachnoclostridium phytofermentans]|uniref:ABC transporter related n=1 Tax=Lachnoclostridium phytofermentans (strain ATCC 700394 / DSM 18823 / ISDg) TaxID=357809 RepID=A9KL38_LACP7|nr:ATP-binding cassette domain-containing protein [Lachnoclostridium phytofermentans]ABX44187.1 ABC transporter related [Lachnoclostridium phytofermentans ISDg]